MFVQAPVLLCVTLVRREWRDPSLVNPSWCHPGVCLKLSWRLFPLLAVFFWQWSLMIVEGVFLPLRLCPQFPFFTFSTLNGIDVPFCFVIPNHSEFNLSPWCYSCTFGLVSSVNLLNLLQLKEEGAEGQENVITQTGIQPGHRVNYLCSCKKCQKLFNDHKQSGLQFDVSSLIEHL